MKTPSRLSSVVLWSVISAAFIGPGTVTTAVTAGSQFGLELLWAVTFATAGCILLQEVSARITIASGLTLGEALVRKFGLRKGRTLQWIVGGSVVVGCAAYEAGNILGAVAGLSLMTGLGAPALTIAVSLTAGLVLWVGGKNWISHLMMLLVLTMGIAFASLAFSQDVGASHLVTSLIVPSIPGGSEMIVLGLIGTTIVPYNVFIGAGISKGQTIPLMRIGLAISVSIGGLITAAILVAGNAITGFSSFAELASALATHVGPWGGSALAIGLFAAGFSSAITAPYATSVIATTVFGWGDGLRPRLLWGSVLATGFVFGISGVRPIPVILAVQAVNGLILPLLTLFLIAVANDERIVPKENAHSVWYDLVLHATLFTVTLIGLSNISHSVGAAFAVNSTAHFGGLLFLSGAVVVYSYLANGRWPGRK